MFPIGVKAIFSRYKRWARKRGYRDIQSGSVSVFQRFDLFLNVHLLELVMDGVCATHPQQARGLHFVRVPAPSTEEIGLLVEKIARKSEIWLRKQGNEASEDWDVDESDALPLFQAVSILTRDTNTNTMRKRSY